MDQLALSRENQIHTNFPFSQINFDINHNEIIKDSHHEAIHELSHGIVKTNWRIFNKPNKTFQSNMRRRNAAVMSKQAFQNGQWRDGISFWFDKHGGKRSFG